MGGQKGTSANRERLKELSDMIRICTSQIRRCKHVHENYSCIIDNYDKEITAIEKEKADTYGEFCKAPIELVKLRRQLDKFRDEQDRITGHVTGRTKLVDKVKKARAKLAALEAELSDSSLDSSLDVDDLQVEPDKADETNETSEFFKDKIS